MEHADIKTRIGQAVELHRSGKFTEAERIYLEVLKDAPDNADALHLLGLIHHQRHEYRTAAGLIRRAIALNPTSPAYHYNLGNAELALENAEPAAAAFRREIALNPNFARAHVNLGCLLVDSGEPEQAGHHLRAALSIDPDNVRALEALGMLHNNCGRPHEAVMALAQAISLAPGDLDLHTRLITTENLDPDTTPQQMLETRRRWARRFAEPLSRTPPQVSDRTPDRRLKIAYVAADGFRFSTCAMALLPIVEGHDPGRVEVHCYSDTLAGSEDGITARFRRAATFHATAGLDDAALAAKIRSDQADIVVETWGHPPGSRLPAIARRPAPIQISLLPMGTSGATAVDYVIGNQITIPPSQDQYFVDRVIRLPIAYTYDPLGDLPEIRTQSPFERNGHITFGCFQQLRKVNDLVLITWARILSNAPGARLLVHPGYTTQGYVEVLRARMTEAGIKADCVEFLPWGGNRAEHLARYGEIDIALDTFPYGGVTTTCEALLMGIPVVAFKADRVLGQYSASFLSAIGQAELATDTIEKYVSAAVGLAEDHERRLALRGSLRDRLLMSRVRNGRAMACNLERVYRAAWHLWCKTANAPT